MTVTVYAHVVARPGSVEHVESACRPIVDDCLREDGVLTYHLLRDVEEPRAFAWFEQWRDEEAFQRHVASPQAARLGAALDGHIEGAMVIKRYDVLS
ncbi:MAG: antibiotic biosynthesis monooxygenase [Actinomycetota bacterium]|nr:antibiotic biosynthesis monooxygenase [Actinomycetota bacterium]